MATKYFRKVKEFFARNYHQRVRVDGERAMDNLVGTMIGVLFLAVISASFAGIYMAYTISSAKASENNARNSIAVKYSTNTLNNLYVESVGGKTTATAAGWNVLKHQSALSSPTSITPSADFSTFTFAATRPMVAGGTTLISQWGKNENGLVTLYTAIPKAGSAASKCNWTETEDRVETLCVVAIDKIQSVVAPPVGVRDEKNVRWADEIVQYPWVSANDWSAATKRDVTTSKLGSITTNGVRNFKYVVMFENLQPGKKVSLDFVESTAGKENTVYSHSFVPTLEPGETGNVTRSNSGTISLPAGVDTLNVYLDTDVAQPVNANDQTIKMYRFIIYTKK